MIASGTQIAAAMEVEWLDARRSSVGASDAPAVVGVCPYRTPIDVWQGKLGLAPPQPESEPMRWGKLLEPVVLAEYQTRTGHELTATQLFVRHPDHPFLTATLDAVRADGTPVEIKTAGTWAREWGDEGTDEVPEPYLIQCHHQMLVTGATAVDLAVLIGGQRFKVFRVERDEALTGIILGRCLEFWRCVESRTPPDWGRVTPAGLLALFPGCEGEVELDSEAHGLVLCYEEFRKKAADVAEALEEVKADILRRLGNAKVGTLPNGRRVTRHVQTVAESTRTVTTKAHTRHYFTVSKGAK